MRPIGNLLERVVRPVQVRPDMVYREIGIRSHCKGIFHKPPVNGARIGDKRVFWIEPGCLIFNIIFAWEQAVAITSKREMGMIASHRFPMYRSSSGELVPQYALLYFSSPRGKHALGIASPGGAGRNKTLGQEEFARLRIPVPPVEYQSYVVGVMATWDAAIEKTGQLIEAKKKLKKALAQQLLTGKKRFKEFVGLGWTKTTLGRVAEVLFSNVDKKTHAHERAVYLCNYLDVYNNQYITNRLNFMNASVTEAEVTKFGLRYGDVIVTKDSETPDDIANPAVVIEQLQNVVCGYHLAILRPRTDIVTGSFLSHVLMLPSVRHQFSRIANGATRFGLTLPDMKKVPLYIPPVREQERISAVLKQSDDEIRFLKSRMRALRQQKKGLMQKLLTGKIRVKV